MASLALVKLLYRSGVLPLFHRIRNRNTLTVIMFHRVLDPRDPRWKTCDPDYTISAQLFTQCLELFRRHYAIVSLDDVLQAHDRALALPPRALLITFDDGWQDNFEYALPVLRRMAIPATIFVVGSAVDRHAADFQERIVAAWRRGELGREALDSMSQKAGIAPPTTKGTPDLAEVRRLIAALESLPAEVLLDILGAFRSVLADDTRYNLSAHELRQLRSAGIAIGAHGMSHTPLTRVESVDGEMVAVRSRLSEILDESPDSIATMSCPHGKFDSGVINSAIRAGYRLVFTSVSALNSGTPAPPHILARVGFESAFIADDHDQLIAPRLALLLFRKPIRRLV